ncbi:MAG: galactokinase [Clostridiales bacterium]|nr:galactokinase [Clostridiales bacterium]
MSQYAHMIRQLKTPDVMKTLTHLYGQRNGILVEQTARYIHIVKHHEELVGAQTPVLLVSAPGRTEIGGNHTDHNKGKVLAAAVNLDTLAAVSVRTDNRVRVFSEGYEPMEMSLEDLSCQESEKGTTVAMIRGVAARMKEMGYAIGGFDAVVTSNVRSGSGLSSSASFEVLACAIFDALYGGWTMDAQVRAQISQYAENVYFGKPSGLMDQMASSVGGLTFMDFKDDQAKIIELPYDFASKDMALVVVNTGGSHDDLTPLYASIPQEMRAVAALFGEKNLRRVRAEQFFQLIPKLRHELKCEHPDRAILRAAHFFEENCRVMDQVEALQRDDLPAFLEKVIESGRSSFMYLQNIVSASAGQELALALMMAEKKLRGKGAWRIHGGGFAGTTLNFVPGSELEEFVKDMESAFGAHSCNVLDIRPVGAAYLNLCEN